MSEGQVIVQTISDNFLYVLIAACILVGIIVNAITRIVLYAGREKSRREIAAYIAEGSISPEQGERLLRADVNRGKSIANC